MFLRYAIIDKKTSEIFSLIFGIVVVAAGFTLAIAAATGIGWDSILAWVGAPIKRLFE